MILNSSNILLCILAVFSFLVGAIPSGYLLAKFWGISDIRNFGSGNIGASNIGRTLGWKAFVLVFFFDALKAGGVLVYAQIFHFSNEQLLVVAGAILLGNCYSPFLGFNGGKGVATLMGIVGVFSLLLMFYAILFWLTILIITRIPAVASISMVCILPLLSYFFMLFSLIPFLLIAVVVIVWRHKKNFKLLSI